MVIRFVGRGEGKLPTLHPGDHAQHVLAKPSNHIITYRLGCASTKLRGRLEKAMFLLLTGSFPLWYLLPGGFGHTEEGLELDIP